MREGKFSGLLSVLIELRPMVMWPLKWEPTLAIACDYHTVPFYIAAPFRRRQTMAYR